ncbi:MAG: nuclear transport factor 2 family protein [Balneolaceae bacterium]|nr:nuclear transport factor 2 family protein [Balneolaceae bacterium]
MMKNPSTIASVVIIIIGFSNVAIAQAPQNEEQKIRQVIDRATHAFGQGDFEEWSSHWMHTDGVLFTYAGSEEFNHFKGWEELGKTMQETMSSLAETRKTDPMVERNNFHYEITNEMAWVYFNQHDNLGETTLDKFETRVLKKVDGTWKIMHVSVIEVSPY